MPNNDIYTIYEAKQSVIIPVDKPESLTPEMYQQYAHSPYTQAKVLMREYFTRLEKTPLTVKFLESGTATLPYREASFSKYKLNDGEWTDFGYNTQIDVQENDTISFICNNESVSGSLFMNFGPKFKVYGNILSVVHGQNFKSDKTIPFVSADKSALSAFFMNSKVVDASELILPTNLIVGSFEVMFMSCSNLEVAPQLPAKELTDNCYVGMFQGCSSLVQAPELPATTLTTGCYSRMFMSCSSLETAPDLPAEILVTGCYSTMFNGCQSLNYIKCLATNPSPDYTGGWVISVSNSGTFVKDANTDWQTNPNGIPSGWDVENNE